VAVLLEFWPEYNSGPLWRSDGTSVDLASLALPADLKARLQSWNAAYDDSRLPFDHDDEGWLEEGERLLAETREALCDAYTIVVTEPWWGEDPSA
jgi:hypothetical protein